VLAVCEEGGVLQAGGTVLQAVQAVPSNTVGAGSTCSVNLAGTT
jgi:hypothetical protein